MDVNVEPMVASDWNAVRAIYEQGITSGDATFETMVPEWEAWDLEHLASPRLVARTGGEVAGWAGLSPVSERCVYEGVAEVSIYVTEGARGKGIGQVLLSALVEGSERAGIWTLQAGVFPENEASVRLHQACGFRVVGVRERLGRMGDGWRDVLLLERRSDVAGV